MLVLGKNLFILGLQLKDKVTEGGEYNRIKKLWYSNFVRVNFCLRICNCQQSHFCSHS